VPQGKHLDLPTRGVLEMLVALWFVWALSARVVRVHLEFEDLEGLTPKDLILLQASESRSLTGMALT
jgi:hypothetical protein